MKPIRLLFLFFSLAAAAVFSLVWSQATTAGATPSLSYPGNPVPSVAAGQPIYSQSCASCHGPAGQGGSANKPIFGAADWSTTYTPGQVAAVSLGQSGSHPAAVSDATSAWHATAFVWTLPLTQAEVQSGQSEIQQAAAQLKKGGLALLLTKGNEIRELQDANWVMSHAEADIVKLITDLAASDFQALDPSQQDALIDYIYAVHFQLPSGWLK